MAYFLKAKNFKLKARAGFTLIETLLASAIMGMILVFGFLTAYSIITRSEKIFQQQALLANQQFLEQKLRFVLSGVSAMASPQAGVPSSSLFLTKINAADNPYVINLVGGVIRLSRQAGPAVALTNSRIIVSNLLFTRSVIQDSTTLEVAATLTAGAEILPLNFTVLIPIALP